jgi:tricorn protease-like protein/C-terminal processing protease CtpA/Prc
MRFGRAALAPCTVALVALAALTPAARAEVRPHAGMLRYPDVSQTRIVFVYANDLWLAPREGGTAVPLASPPGQETFPRFSPDGRTIAFVGNYDGNRDLYTIPVEGGVPVRVTHHPATEDLCDWTPDGELLFSTNALAGLARMSQLYTVSPEGGLPQKLPVPYGTMAAISPDGQWLAYTPHSRESRTWKRYRGGMATDVWLFHLEDHVSKKITDWEGTDGVPMWHGETIYYLSDAGPNHRLNIWAYHTGAGGHEPITDFNEYDVKWPAIGPGPNGQGEIVFQNGSDLYLLDLATRKARAVEIIIPGDRPKIRPQTIDVHNRIHNTGISSTGKRAVVEARGDIWTVPAEKGSPRNLTRTDGVAERDPAWSPDKKWIAYFSDATGEYELFITQSDGKGETRQLTEDGEAFRYNPTWSPNSKHIAFSDKSATMYLHTIESGETKVIDQDPWGRRLSASWSHDSQWIAYPKSSDNQQHAIWLYNVETGEKHQATSGMFSDSSPTFDRKGDYLYFASAQRFGSPIYEDVGSSFVYTGTHRLLAVPLRADMEYVWAPKVDDETWDEEEEKEKDKDKGKGEEEEEEKEEEDRAGESEARAEPTEDDGVSGVWEGTIKGDESLPPEGLAFTLTLRLRDDTITGTMTAGPYSGTITEGTYDRQTGGLTFSLEMSSDQGTQTFSVTATIEDGSMSGSASGENFSATFTATRTSTEVPEEGEKEEEKEAKKKVEIDLEGFEQRALLLPVDHGRFGHLAVNNKNQLIYARRELPGSGKPAAIQLFDIDDEKKEEKTVVSGAGAFDISADGKKLLVRTGSTYAIIDAKAGQKLDKKISLEDLRATIDPREEWRQVFNDAWRIQRDFFYAANMHGVDWPAVREQYAKMLDDCASREDVSYVIGEMIAELNVGHAYYWGGGTEQPPNVSVGMLGCDFELDQAAYRISKIYEGGRWDSDARGPLSQPGVDVKAGDYLLAVNGIPLDTSKDPWAAFQGLAGRTVTLTVSAKPQIDEEAREVNVELLRSEGDLRFRAWIEHNRAYVEEKTGGRVGYIYVPDTGRSGQNELFRQFYGQRDKAGLIIDERWNGGGQVPNRFIELLNRPVLNYWARRHGQVSPTPSDAHHGPKCMLINGLAGSGGDLFPYYFRETGLGQLIGTRTWGGLVGISGNPPLIDGGYVTVPTFAFFETDGTWGVEGHGVDPDITVIDDPAKMVDGADPQLDAATEHVLAEIERNPYVPPERPPYPDRSGMGVREEDK